MRPPASNAVMVVPAAVVLHVAPFSVVNCVETGSRSRSRPARRRGRWWRRGGRDVGAGITAVDVHRQNGCVIGVEHAIVSAVERVARDSAERDGEERRDQSDAELPCSMPRCTHPLHVITGTRDSAHGGRRLRNNLDSRPPMQALRLIAGTPVSLLAVVALVPLAAGCHAEAHVKASTSEDTKSDFSEPAATAPAQPQTTTAAAPPPSEPSTPPADACPLTCYEARGSEAVDLRSEEITQLRSALEPVIGRMRQCVAPEEWRRHGSATVNLRIAPDGTLSELGVDPGHGSQSSCFDDVGRGATARCRCPGTRSCAARSAACTSRRRRAGTAGVDRER